MIRTCKDPSSFLPELSTFPHPKLIPLNLAEHSVYARHRRASPQKLLALPAARVPKGTDTARARQAFRSSRWQREKEATSRGKEWSYRTGGRARPRIPLTGFAEAESFFFSGCPVIGHVRGVGDGGCGR
jgi:hypothetical protein